MPGELIGGALADGRLGERGGGGEEARGGGNFGIACDDTAGGSLGVAEGAAAAFGVDGELAPIRVRAQELRATPEIVDDVLATGAAKAQAIASATLGEAKQIMGLR